MKNCISFLLILFAFMPLSAQFQAQGTIKSPVSWEGNVEKESAKNYTLTFKAKIKEGWHVFSQFTPEGGSLPLAIKYLEESKDYETNGKTEESETTTQYNEVFGVDEIIFENNATLTQDITLKNANTRYVKTELSYQVCQESCINQEFYFVFDLKDKSAEIFENYDDFEAFGEDASGGTAKTSKTNSQDGGAGQAGMGMQSQGNIKSPVSWSGQVEKESAEDYDLVFKAKIKEGWHVFSQFTAEGGSLPLGITYLKASEDYDTNGKTEESETSTQYNEVFGVDETIFEDEATLTQNISLNKDDVRYVKAQVNYQVCQESCINEEYYFVFDLQEESAQVLENYDDFMAFGSDSAGNSNDLSSTDQSKTTAGEDGTQIESSTSGASKEDRGLWTIFVLAFLWGLAALLTPCVFPMIPMTVGFFTKQSKTKAKGIRNALLYGLFIVVIYVVLGSLFTGIFGADALNALSTNVTFNIIFFIILVFFAVSFLGAFEIVLPSSWANKVDKQADRGGIIGIFFMALALAIVSFSCTGPIIGTLLVQAASKGGIAPIVGMLGFSLAIAVPFGLFALFPSWMNSLPKSGGWLNAVKVVLGFLELALAFKFLSNADLVLQANILPREIFLTIWIAIFLVLALYLFGKIRLPNDSPVEYISVGRLGMGLLVLTFTIYLIPGLWGAPLKLISGFPPPMNYSEAPHGVGYSKVSFSGGSGQTMPENAELGPQNVISFHDYEEGLAYAKSVNKPVFLDFTGKACINCRKMEERVWGEPQILPKLKSDVVVVSLFVDIKEELPEDEQYTSETTGKRIRTVGNKWSDFQIKHYQMNAQPYYVLLDPANEKLLNDPVGYTPDVEDFEAWLKEGIGNYKK